MPRNAVARRDALTRTAPLSELVPDSRNANRGTVRGRAMLEDSLQEDGAGRGILLDKHGNVIAGNKTLETAFENGFSEVVIVPTDGKQLVATQRMDVDIDSPQGRRMAIRDNRVAQVDLDFDGDVLRSLADDGLDLSRFWNDGEIAHLLNQGDELDYSATWQGMPEFNQQDKLGKNLIIVHFATDDDRRAFATLIGQPLTEKTHYIWFPKQETFDAKQYRVTDES